MEVYIFNIDKIDNIFNYDKFYEFVNKEKKQKVMKFRRNEDKIRSLVGDTLTRVISCKHLECKNKDIKYKYNEYGKPYIKENLEFNISHSGEYVVVAIDDCPVGIDIEEMKNIEFEGIAKGYYDESEYKWIINHEKEQQMRCFYKLWTLKESYVKYVGKGLSIAFNSFKFKINEKKNLFEIDKNSDGEIIHFKNYDLVDKYQLSICSVKDEVLVKNIDYKLLLEMMDIYD
jgi:4'-phosphopantetheinyl transferase